MHVTVMGSGGVGGYFGARLAQAGCKVTFVARGRQLQALQTHGLKVLSAKGDVHLKEVHATADVASIGNTDLVLFSVKLWDTAEAALAIRPIVSAQTAVVSFQNGVVKDDILRHILGEGSVLGGVCYVAATIAEPGVIRHSGVMQKMVFGEYDGSVSPRVERFRDACLAAGIDTELSVHIRQTLWEKFVFLVGLSGTTCLTRGSIGPIRSEAAARAFLHDTMNEVVQVARAESVDLPSDFATDRLAFCDQLPATMTSSMHNDLERGGRLEVPWLSGDVVARGTRLGVPTPCNRAIFSMLSVHAAGQRSS